MNHPLIETGVYMRLRYLIPLAVVMLPSLATADNCEIAVSAADGMAYDTRSINVPASCETFTVNFEHKGRLPKGGMGHNWVLTKSADVNDVAKAGSEAGIANDFLPEDDSRVIAATPLLGGGEKASVSFKTAELSTEDSYTFFCSFPGHWAMMRGSLQLVN